MYPSLLQAINQGLRGVKHGASIALHACQCFLKHEVVGNASPEAQRLTVGCVGFAAVPGSTAGWAAVHNGSVPQPGEFDDVDLNGSAAQLARPASLPKQ